MLSSLYDLKATPKANMPRNKIDTWNSKFVLCKNDSFGSHFAHKVTTRRTKIYKST